MLNRPHTIAAPRVLLLDFDGVISPNSLALRFAYMESLLSEQGIDPALVRRYARTVAAPLRAETSWRFFLQVFGMDWSESLLSGMEADVIQRIELDPSLPGLLNACRATGISARVMSTAGRHLLATIPGFDESMCCTSRLPSKADPAAFLDVVTQVAARPEDVLMVDDCPLVLRAAKIAGLRTAIVSGPVFPEQDVAPYARYIDMRLESLGDLLCGLSEEAESKDN